MSVPPHPNRPWPVPRSPWVLAMTWRDLLFMHWPVDPALLRPLIPDTLQLDTFDGAAWLGVVPFVMHRTRARGLPPPPLVSTFPELNVRTYVTAGGKPGVWFFSLDAASRVAVEAARLTWGLPYFRAAMRVAHDGDAVRYTSERGDRRGPAARFDAAYRPTGPVFHAQPGTLDHFFTERYCLYTARKRGEIAHRPWPLQRAACDIAALNMTRLLGFPLPDTPPRLHFARELDVVAWLPTRFADHGDGR